MYPHLHLFSGVDISTYFLIISIGVTVSVMWFIRLAEQRHLARVVAIDISLAVLIGGFVGARLMHILYEEPAIYRANPLLILEIWNGGFVFLGGLIGAFFTTAILCRIKGEPFWFWADVATLPVSLSYMIGRMGCLLNGCCYGQPAEVPWAITINGAARHPTQLYASLWELFIFAMLYLAQSRIKISGYLFNSWLIAHSLGRLVMEAFRDDPRGGLVLGVSVSTAISLALITWAVANIVASRLQSTSS